MSFSPEHPHGRPHRFITGVCQNGHFARIASLAVSSPRTDHPSGKVRSIPDLSWWKTPPVTGSGGRFRNLGGTGGAIVRVRTRGTPVPRCTKVPTIVPLLFTSPENFTSRCWIAKLRVEPERAIEFDPPSSHALIGAVDGCPERVIGTRNMDHKTQDVLGKSKDTCPISRDCGMAQRRKSKRGQRGEQRSRDLLLQAPRLVDYRIDYS